ncbi:hybrid sensor histidine kinase/response regulator [Roseomonas sp. USHLN139]|uniref:hybrid sensor histidine kinase/response regulator n=1 Tax=Roseomonas sp. USHLN139 TaxID=3081298 RepID=UPI003B02DAEC
MRAFDWQATRLGPTEAWPQSLRTAVCLMLHAKQPMFLAWGPELTLLYNDDYATVLGSKHPRALGQAFEAAWSDIWPQFGPIVQQVIGGRALSFEDLPIPMRRNGYPEDTWFSFSYTPIHSEDGSIAGLFCACIETTAKVLGERALRNSEAKLEALVAARTAELDRVWRNSRDLLVIINAEGIFQAVSPAWTAVLGHKPAEVVGRSFLDFIWPEDAEPTLAALGRAANQLDLISFENRYRHIDGTVRWISWSTSFEGELVYAYGRHVTVEKEQAAALQRTEERLRQAQKMEAIGQLTGGLAHDFNNLMLGITGSLELLSTRIDQGRSDGIDRYVDAARGAADRAASLTHRLLAFSRQQTLDPRPIRVSPLITGMQTLLRGTVGPAISVQIKLGTDVWPILCDPNQLENALLNLCINARDAMPNGGQLTIATSNLDLDEADANARGLPAGQHVAICVTDTGVGMTPEVSSRAFEPFFTTKPIGQGTGLGLSMVYGFVQQSGGHVQILSEAGQGTTICLHLPRFQGEVPAAGAEEEPVPEALVSTRVTVLVVDDEATIRMLVTEVLADLGYVVLEAPDAASGLELLRSTARIDLLISDIGLPGGMNGRQMVNAARHLRPDLKVLFITGYAEQALLGEGRLEPGMQVMTKPFALGHMTQRIKDMLLQA